MKYKYLFGIGILIIVSLIALKVVKDTRQNSSSKSSKSQIRPPLPKEVTIKVGGAVRWVNKSGSQETVN